jgi:hypothetical protein
MLTGQTDSPAVAFMHLLAGESSGLKDSVGQIKQLAIWKRKGQKNGEKQNEINESAVKTQVLGQAHVPPC